jgi:hypothetical protein
MVADPYVLGKIIAVLPPGSARGLSYTEVLRSAQRMLPTTDIEKKMLDYATVNAGTHIRGVMDLTLRRATVAITSARGAALRAVQEGVVESIANRDTISELKTRLFDVIDDSARDWHRVAFTEMNNAVQNGVYDDLREKSDDGENQLVYKLPNPDACVHCKRVYLQPDGTPRIFRLKDLQESNVGSKAADWGPTIGSVHPWCSCQLIVIPEGHEFVKERIISEPFEKTGRKYKKGQILTEAEYSGLSSEEKTNVGRGAVLRHTGGTPGPTKKSLVHELISESGMYCDHN